MNSHSCVCRSRGGLIVWGLVALALGFVSPRGTALADDKQAPGEWGTISGHVVLDAAEIPAPKPITVTKDPDHCLSKGPLFSEELVVNKENKGVRWVFVWLAPLNKEDKLPIHPSLKEPKQKQVEVDQPCCQFVPHALGMRQGQSLLAKNSAPVAHNIHWVGHPLKNAGGNVIVPAGQSHTIEGLQADRFPVKLSCDIHGWMSAYVRVFDHPYFAVTDADGKFEIKLAPAGDYRLVVWSDNGWGPGGRDGTPIKVKPNGTTDPGEIKLKPPE